MHPEVGGARENAFCERKDAFHVEFFELAAVTVNPSERELLAQFLGVAVVRLDINRALEDERLVQTVQLLLMESGSGAEPLIHPSEEVARHSFSDAAPHVLVRIFRT